jgi:hypothetical protein
MTNIQYNRLMKAIMTGCHVSGANFKNNNLSKNCVIGSMLLHAGLSREECLEAGLVVSELSEEHLELFRKTYGVDYDDLLKLQELNDEIENDKHDHIKERRENVSQYVCDHHPRKGRK